MGNQSSSINAAVSFAKFEVPALDGLRAIAFLLVFFAHAGLSRLVPGGFGVTVFFFLSGYLITTLLRIESNKTGDISLWNFYVRRAARILPPLYITLLLVCLVVFFSEHKVYVLKIIGTLLYVNNYLGLIWNLHSPVPGVWSLAVEEHFYLLFPLLFMIWTRRKVTPNTQALVLFLFCMVALMWRMFLVFVVHIQVPTANDEQLYIGWTYAATDCRFDAIAWGCLLAVRDNPWFASKPNWLSRHKGLFACMGVATILASLLYRNPYFRETLRYTLQSAALYPIFYYCVATPSSWVSRTLSLKPVRWLGWLSYSLYLIHSLALEWLPKHWHPVMIGVCAFVLSLGYGWLMRVAVELPSHHMRDKFLRKPAPRPYPSETSAVSQEA